MELKNTVAVITGSTGKLGSEIALAIAKAGCDCICHYNKNKQKAEQLTEQIGHLGQNAIAVSADLTCPDQIKVLFEKASKLGAPQILINSAAVFTRQPLQQVTFENAQKVLSLNLIAPILISKHFAEIIRAKFPEPNSVVGKIINISDTGAIRPWAEYAVYCSSKAGLVGATKALAKELAPAICVNSIAPGIIDWPAQFNEKEKTRQLSLIPANRFARPDEITKAILFLLENDYITGQVLNIAGGRCI